MSSDPVFDATGSAAVLSPLHRVALFGGGRWSRVLLPVMQALLPESAEIVWITQHGQSFAQRWLTDKAIERVTIRPHVDLQNESFDAAVVATAPAAHAGLVRELLEHQVPTFCEKPFTLDFAEAVELERKARAADCPLGVNLELHCASFLEDFAIRVPQHAVQDISIDWYDPWVEQRYGEWKHGDVYTRIVDDMWPHCWSILRRLCPDQSVQAIEGVRYDPVDGRVEFTARLNAVPVRVALSRRGAQRVRRIEMNRGELVLDFSVEPGWAKLGDDVSQNYWRGDRPLSRSLSSFFEVVVSPERATSWPLAVTRCLDAVRFAQAAGGELLRGQEQRFEELRRTGVQLADSAHRNLIVDMQLPVFAEQGCRYPAIAVDEQVAFVKHVCELQNIDYH
jgi:predicted dehydrogenase